MTSSTSGPALPLSRGGSEWLLLVDHRVVAALNSRGRFGAFAYEFIRFGVKMAWACLFGALMLALLIDCYANGTNGRPRSLSRTGSVPPDVR